MYRKAFQLIIRYRFRLVQISRKFATPQLYRGYRRGVQIIRMKFETLALKVRPPGCHPMLLGPAQMQSAQLRRDQITAIGRPVANVECGNQLSGLAWNLPTRLHAYDLIQPECQRVGICSTVRVGVAIYFEIL